MHTTDRLPLLLAAGLLLAPATAAQDPVATPRSPVPIAPGRPLKAPRDARLWTVGGLSTGADFRSAQEAIDQARDGDVILVRSSFPDEAVIDGKSLTLIGAFQQGEPFVARLDEVVLRNVTGTVVVRGFRIDEHIEAESCSGTLWLEEIEGAHLYLRDCASVLVTDYGPVSSSFFQSSDIVGSNSNVAIWDSEIRGVPGRGEDVYEFCYPCADCDYMFCDYGFGSYYTCACLGCSSQSPPTDGEPAIWLVGTSSVFLSGSTVTGGRGGGWSCSTGPPGADAPAVRSTPSSSLVYLDTVFTSDTTVIEGNPSLLDLARTSGSLSLTSPIIGDQDAVATLAGKPDTQALVLTSTRLAVAVDPLRFGLAVVNLSNALTFHYGAVPSDGSPIVGVFPVWDYSRGEAAVLFTQSLFVEDLGGGVMETVLGSPATVIQIDGDMDPGEGN